jgi:endonuclease YncB( thermonuclease family)
MPLTLIQGRFRILNTEPDGDSIRFVPTDPGAFTTAGVAAKAGSGGAVQLRLDAIDALETHYTPRVPGGSVHHQPPEFADAAAARLLDILGFTDVQRAGQRVTAATPAETDGYILTRFADKYGRPVSFAFAGTPDEADLSSVFLDADRLRTSANYQLTAAGLVYPTYYSKLYADLRETLTTAATAARAAGSGLWSKDTTQTGTTISDQATLTDQAVILPKLFRRLTDYLALGEGDVSLDRLPAFLAAHDDRLFVLSERRATGFDNIITVTGQTVALTKLPEDLVFLEA